ncbi:MAG TPA: hypothetical protein VF278_00900, partial [Pirellulales bacterium]
MHESDQELIKQLLSFVSGPKYRPAKPRQLAKKLDVPEHRLRDFKRLVKELVKRGQLAYADKHRIVPPAGAPEKGQARKHADGHLTGVFRRNGAGFGFVRPAG